MTTQEDIFWDLSERLIETANTLSQEHERADVCDALLYSSARFSAYVAAVGTESRNEFKEQFAEIKALLMEQFGMMLDANMDEYLEHYKVYIEKERSS